MASGVASVAAKLTAYPRTSHSTESAAKVRPKVRLHAILILRGLIMFFGSDFGHVLVERYEN
jgi:hypothetical protein